MWRQGKWNAFKFFLSILRNAAQLSYLRRTAPISYVFCNVFTDSILELKRPSSAVCPWQHSSTRHRTRSHGIMTAMTAMRQISIAPAERDLPLELPPLMNAPVSKGVLCEEERMQRLASAVALVEHGGPAGKASVRTAARIYGIPKSTLHRYIQANRGVESLRSLDNKSCYSYSQSPRKCDISFLINRDDTPVQQPHQEPRPISFLEPSAQTAWF